MDPLRTLAGRHCQMKYPKQNKVKTATTQAQLAPKRTLAVPKAQA